MIPIPVFVGYDPRESVAYHVCVNSIIRHASQPVAIVPVALNLFQDYNETHTDGSNQFIYSRFLVPSLMNYSGWAIFIDGDMILRDDIVKLWELKNPDKDVMVVKHDYKTRMPVKYMGAKNEDYPRKNWSSVILWNCSSSPNQCLTPEFVQSQPGSFLHRFSWLDDERIGELPIEWNWLPDEFGDSASAKLLHYTLGAPCFKEFSKTNQAHEWHAEFDLTKYCEQNDQAVEISALPAPDNSVTLRKIELPPAQPEVHVLDAVPDGIQKLFQDILTYRVDPAGDYFNMQASDIIQQIHALDTKNILGLDSEFRYKEKGKMFDPIIQSFTLGCGGQIASWSKSETSATPVVMRGITKRKEMAACRAANRDFYYIDTGYFGNGKKKTFHRITKNDVQNLGPILDRPRDRLAATGFQARKFYGGSRILLAPPSQKLLNLYDIELDAWLESVLQELAAKTDREVIVRRKPGRTARTSDDSMAQALTQDIHCLVTFSSIAAGEALLNGKPAITLGPNAASALCSKSLDAINEPYVPTLDEVEQWAAHLSYCQFTEVEMRNGLAWRILQGD